MIKIIKATLTKLFPKAVLQYKVAGLLIRNNESYLYTTGWVQSVEKKQPIDRNGEFIPWMNYAVAAFLKARMDKSMVVFEFGSGYSTMFYAKYTKTVLSTEHDENWLSKISEKLPDNAEVQFVKLDEDGDYCRSVKRSGSKYDIVIVDGRDRANCVAQALDELTDRGVILLDDSDRQRYDWATKLAESRGFRTLVFESLKPGSSILEQTTLIYRDNNCLGV